MDTSGRSRTIVVNNFAGREVAGETPAVTAASRLASLAGDMWNELDNLRDLWLGTDRQVHCEMLIEEYESLSGIGTRGGDAADNAVGAQSADAMQALFPASEIPGIADPEVTGLPAPTQLRDTARRLSDAAEALEALRALLAEMA